VDESVHQEDPDEYPGHQCCLSPVGLVIRVQGLQLLIHRRPVKGTRSAGCTAARNPNGCDSFAQRSWLGNAWNRSTVGAGGVK
jgi:hypothetical protein